MTFLHPLTLLALVAIPLLVWWYGGQQRRRAKAATAFAAPALGASVAPSRPRWRRHAPMLVFALALAVLIVAAARPQRVVAVPVNTASIILANDTSGSMAATDVAPSRLRAAQRAAAGFIASVPNSVRVGLVDPPPGEGSRGPVTHTHGPAGSNRSGGRHGSFGSAGSNAIGKAFDFTAAA